MFALQKLREWREKPLIFATEALQVVPSEQQIEGLLRFANAKRMTIRSGHGTGKDAFASWGILWFMCTRPYAKIICTAPTGRQLSDILWSELSKWLRKSSITEEFIIQKDKIFHKDAPKEWWIRAVSASVSAAKEEQAETLAGFHGDHMLIVADEASGIPDPVYIPLEGAMTQEDNKCLLIGNMTRNTGYFYDTHFHPQISKRWEKLHWDSRKSTNVSKDMVNYFLEKYGEESNVFRIRVAGDPPLADDNTLIPLHWAQACIGQEIQVAEDEPTYLGVDVARYGEDDSVILPRTGLLVHPWESFHGMNTIDLGGNVLQVYAETEADGIMIDEIGVGAGLTDWLTKHRSSSLKVYGVNVSMASSDKMRWHRLRDELWVVVRDKVMRQQYSFPSGVLGEEIANELACPRYTFDLNGAFVVESKKELKARGIHSPNIADGLCLTEYVASYAKALFKKDKEKKKNRRPWEKLRNALGRDAWRCH